MVSSAGHPTFSVTYPLDDLSSMAWYIMQSTLLVMDVNADGLLDAVVPAEGVWKTAFNLGQESGRYSQPVNDGSPSVNWQYAQPVDYNKDGRADIFIRIPVCGWYISLRCRVLFG